VKLAWVIGVCALYPILFAGETVAADYRPQDDNGFALLRANLISDIDQFGNVEGRGSLSEKAKELGSFVRIVSTTGESATAITEVRDAAVDGR